MKQIFILIIFTSVLLGSLFFVLHIETILGGIERIVRSPDSKSLYISPGDQEALEVVKRENNPLPGQ